MRPVNMRTSFALVHRAGCTHDEDRNAVNERIIDGHCRVQQTNQIMQDDGKRLAASLRIAMSHLHGDFLVLTHEHRGIVLAIVD